MNARRVLLLISFLAATSQVAAQESSWDFSANVELQSRLFMKDNRWPGQASRR